MFYFGRLPLFAPPFSVSFLTSCCFGHTYFLLCCYYLQHGILTLTTNKIEAFRHSEGFFVCLPTYLCTLQSAKEGRTVYLHIIARYRHPIRLDPPLSDSHIPIGFLPRNQRIGIAFVMWRANQRIRRINESDERII